MATAFKPFVYSQLTYSSDVSLNKFFGMVVTEKTDTKDQLDTNMYDFHSTDFKIH